MKIKKGVTKNGRVQYKTYTYDIVHRTSNGWERSVEAPVDGTEVKFKIVHKYVGVNENTGRFKNELCAEIVKYIQ
jgi:hypothetical protein